MTDTIHTVTLTPQEQAAYARGWNRAIEAAAKMLQATYENWDCGHNESRLCNCGPYAEQWGMASDEVRALSMPAPPAALISDTEGGA